MIQENLIKIYERSFQENREMSALTDYFKKESFSYYEMAKEIAKLHLLFKKVGIKKGDKIALVGRNNPRWCISYIATITYGAVIVPILQDFTSNDIIHIVNHSESRLLFTDQPHWQAVDTDRMPNLEAAFDLAGYKVIYEKEVEEDTPSTVATEAREAIDATFAERYPNGFSAEDIHFHEVPNENLILLNYTSGTTGDKKGVMLSSQSLVSNLIFEPYDPIVIRVDTILSVLPLHHIFCFICGYIGPLNVGNCVCLNGEMKDLFKNLLLFKPNQIRVVPLIAQGILARIRAIQAKNPELSPKEAAAMVTGGNLDMMLAKRKMTLSELSERVDISIVNLSILKTGKARAVRLSTLDAICDVLDCQPGDILEFRKE